MLQWIWKLAVALAAIVAAVAWLDRSNTQEYIEIDSDDDEEEDAFGMPVYRLGKLPFFRLTVQAAHKTAQLC